MYLFFIKEFGRNYITVYSVHYLYHSVFCDSVGFKNIVVQLLSHVWLFVTPWTAACQASLSLTISQILPKFMSIESVMLSTVLSSATLFSFCLQSFPAWESFPMTRLFTSGGQSIGASASASVLPKSIQGYFPLDWLVWSPCSPRDSQRIFSIQVQMKV